MSLAACVALGPTPFQPARNGLDGYTVTQIETDRFRVAFNGNASTTQQMVDDNLVYLAAQVTLRNGADWFLMERDATNKSTAYPTFLTPGTIYGGGPWSPPFVAPGGFQTDFANPQDSWSSSATIVLHKGTKPADNTQAYDAHDVDRHLAPLIRRGTPPGPY